MWDDWDKMTQNQKMEISTLTLLQIIHLHQQFRWPFCGRINLRSFCPADVQFWRSEWRKFLRILTTNDDDEKGFGVAGAVCFGLFTFLDRFLWWCNLLWTFCTLLSNCLFICYFSLVSFHFNFLSSCVCESVSVFIKRRNVMSETPTIAQLSIFEYIEEKIVDKTIFKKRASSLFQQFSRKI